MKLKCRLTHNLAEIKVDEIEVTLFKSHPQEIDDMIDNLLDIVDDLKKLKGEIEKQQQDEFAIDFIKWTISQEAEDLIYDLKMIGEVSKIPTTEEVFKVYKRFKNK